MSAVDVLSDGGKGRGREKGWREKRGRPSCLFASAIERQKERKESDQTGEKKKRIGTNNLVLLRGKPFSL